MNPFEKLKLTIDRVGLEYLPSKDYQHRQQTNYINVQQQKQNTRQHNNINNQQQQQSDLPYFKSSYQGRFHQRTNQYYNEQIQQLKYVYQNQQKNYLKEINQLNRKLQLNQRDLILKQKDNQYLTKEINSLEKQNQQLRSYVRELEERSSRKLSESHVNEKERKYKEEIDRINITVNELATSLNTEKVNKKNIQKQLQTLRSLQLSKENQQNYSNKKYQQQIQSLRQQLQQRNSLLQHSIKTSTQDKLTFKRQQQIIKQKFDMKINQLSQQLLLSKETIYQLKNQIVEMKCQNQTLTNRANQMETKSISLRKELEGKKGQIEELNQQNIQLKNSLQQAKLQIYYLNSDLQQEKTNTKLKVVEVRDETLQMELSIYKKQYKDLIKQKAIWDSLRNSKSEYTVIEHSQQILREN